ncbi:MAG: hypothetical protein IKH61_12970 [Bacteroidales bacterium]|nr:hypothetical protein [Bacteroidales bacterium]
MSSYDKNNVVTDSRMEVFQDGSTILLISTFLDGKCQGITMYTRVRRSSKTRCEAREQLLECETSNPMASEVKRAL